MGMPRGFRGVNTACRPPIPSAGAGAGSQTAADERASVTLRGGGFTLPHQNPNDALGPPDYDDGLNGETRTLAD